MSGPIHAPLPGVRGGTALGVDYTELAGVASGIIGQEKPHDFFRGETLSKQRQPARDKRAVGVGL